MIVIRRSSLPSRSAAALAAAYTLLLTGCTRFAGVPDTTVLTCSRTADCPGGRVCHNGRCVVADAIDARAPDLVPGSLGYSPAGARVRAGQQVTVSFRSDEPLAAAPAVTLGLSPPAPLACTSPDAAAATAWECRYTAAGTENGGAGGDISFDVRMTDRSGNEALRSAAGKVTFDFAAPSPLLASVAYGPAATNPLASVQRATAGTVVRVVVSADEVLSTQPASLVGRHGGEVLTFQPVVLPGLGANDAAFEATVPALKPDGSYALEVTWADDLGNGATAAAPASVEVKTSVPVLQVSQDALVFVRSPLGGAADEVLGAYTVPAGPYFAVEPADALTTSTTLPPGALLLAGGALPSRVIVQSRADAQSALVLGVLEPQGGLFPRQKLASPDLAAVWLVGVDDAGNRSTPIRLRDSEWVATPSAPAFGPRPHALTETGYAGPGKQPRLGENATVAAGGDGHDAEAALALAGAAWVTGLDATTPGERASHAMAYDAGRARIVLFGGLTAGGAAGDTWEWDGARWTLIPTAGAPTARYDHAMVYDSARDRVVLFGGRDATGPLGDTWEWDGTRWTLVASEGPGDRMGHAMAYDAARARVVVFGGAGAGAGSSGGLADAFVWEWDGASWTSIAAPGPSPRESPRMAYDAVRGTTLLFGGGDIDRFYQDTWTWDGAVWTSVASGGPATRVDHAMAYDETRRRVVLFGGGHATSFGFQDTWEWTGTAWEQRATGGPTRRYGHAMAYDGTRGRVVLFSGLEPLGGTPLLDTQEWDGTSWTELPTTAGPPQRHAHAMAYDATRQVTVLQGGYVVGASGETWEWDGRTWSRRADLWSRRYDHAMAYDRVSGRVLVHGGWDGSTYHADTQRWDGASWTTVATGGPGTRYGHAMATAPSPAGAILFGGRQSSLGSPLGDTWTWSGSAWSLAASTGPAPRSGHAMAYDAARGRVVLFGGADAIGELGDTWEWTGTDWVLAATTGPTPRAGHAMAYDAARGRVVLYGGGTSSVGLRETWEWDGTSWTPGRSAGPGPRTGHAMAHDAARGRTVLFGGLGADGATWTAIAAPDRRPAVQLDVATSSLGVEASRISRLWLRAFAGGRGAPAIAGATLFGWAARGPANEPGTWLELTFNETGLAARAPWLPAGSAAYLGWSTSGAAEIRRHLLEREGFSFQLRPTGPAGTQPDAGVAVDYVELRVRYAAP